MRIAHGDLLVKAGPKAHRAMPGCGLDKQVTVGKEGSIEVKAQTKARLCRLDSRRHYRSKPQSAIIAATL